MCISLGESGNLPACGLQASGPEVHIATDEDIRQGISLHLTRLWRYGFLLSQDRDTADDLVQSTCIRALERMAQYSVGTRLDHWLLAILHSIWLNEVRARRIRLGEGFVDAAQALVLDGSRETENRVLANQVMRHVFALPEAQRVTVFLCYVEGLSYREAADTLQIPVGTVMSRLATARARIAELSSEPRRQKQSESERS